MPYIHQAVLIASSAQEVYKAITSQEGLSSWWTPKATAEARVNSIAHFPFGPNYHKEMKITALESNQFVKWDCIHGAEEWIGTNISFTLIAGEHEIFQNQYPEIQGQLEQLKSKSGTLLIFHHDNWREDSLMFEECSYTWGQFLKSLKLYCETGKGRPWPTQHQSL